MNTSEDFIKEIDGYTIEELELIYETQKDLYTSEEMDYILSWINLNIIIQIIIILQKKPQRIKRRVMRLDILLVF